MKAGQWMFNHQPDDVWGTGSYHDTKESAIAEGKSYYLPSDYETLYVGQIEPIGTAISVDAERILEDIAENIYEQCGEAADDYLRYVKPDHDRILSERLSEVVNQWMQEFGYAPNFFKIVNVNPFKNE